MSENKNEDIPEEVEAPELVIATESYSEKEENSESNSENKI